MSIQFCCQPFKELIDRAGQKGPAVVVSRRGSNPLKFRLQSRGVAHQNEVAFKKISIPIEVNIWTLDTKSAWLTVGKVYLVLEIYFEAKGRRLLRLLGDGRNGPALFPWECFEFVSLTIPSGWKIVASSADLIKLTTQVGR